MHDDNKNLKIRLFNALSYSHKYISNPSNEVSVKYIRDNLAANKPILDVILEDGTIPKEMNPKKAFHLLSQSYSAVMIGDDGRLDKSDDFFKRAVSKTEDLLAYIRKNDPVISEYIRMN